MAKFEEVWHTRDEGPILVKDMKRSHVRNSLQWCMKREGDTILGTGFDIDWTSVNGNLTQITSARKDKDGYYYRDWIAIFVARLLDPELDA